MKLNPQCFFATLYIIIPIQNPINKALIMESDFIFLAFIISSSSDNSDNSFLFIVVLSMNIRFHNLDSQT